MIGMDVNLGFPVMVMATPITHSHTFACLQNKANASLLPIYLAVENVELE